MKKQLKCSVLYWRWQVTRKQPFHGDDSCRRDFFVSAILVFVGLASRSLLSSILGILGCGTAFIFFDPIGPFLQPPSSDPDMLYWTGKYKVLGMTWGIVTLASIVSTVLAFYLKARKRGDSGAPLPVQGSNL